MKRIFHFRKIELACLLIFYIFPSCSTIQRETGTLTAEVITITQGDIKTGVLATEDHLNHPAGDITVEPLETIQWKLGTGPRQNVKSIEEIYEKAHNRNLFDPRPNYSNMWKGTIKKRARPGMEENYYISWKDTSGGIHTYDPRIQIKSK